MTGTLALVSIPPGEPPSEPGLDLHDWLSAWASIEEEAGDAYSRLSQEADLVHRMLVASGYRVDDPVVRAGEEPEVVVTYLAAREAAERAEIGIATRNEVAQALADLRAVFETLTRELQQS